MLKQLATLGYGIPTPPPPKQSQTKAGLGITVDVSCGGRYTSPCDYSKVLLKYLFLGLRSLNIISMLLANDVDSEPFIKL